MRCGTKWVVAALLAAVTSAALANGRPPLANGVHFRAGDPNAVYVATTFGLLVSPDACHFYWLCEQDIGYGGEFDPQYGVTAAGTILATTFQGLRISRDGGCSFTSALTGLYTTGLAVGPTGDVWVGTSESGSANAVYVSHDDAQTLDPAAGLPGTMWFPSLAVAPSAAGRVYVAAYSLSGSVMPPTSHWFRTDDGGASWIELPVTAIAFASSPSLVIAAIAPADPDTVLVISRLANPPYGDLVYRSRDAGATLTEVAATTSSITGLVVRDASRVEIATSSTGMLESTDGGATFAPLATTLQFGCLGQRGDGTLFACASDYDPDDMALGSSPDARTWTTLLRFEFLTGTVDCPSGTVESDICDGELWRGLTQQIGEGSASTCASGPGGPLPELPRDGISHGGGCCDVAPPGQSASLALIVGWLLRRRRQNR